MATPERGTLADAVMDVCDWLRNDEMPPRKLVETLPRVAVALRQPVEEREAGFESSDGLLAFLVHWPHWKHEQDGTAYITMPEINRARSAYVRQFALRAAAEVPDGQ